MIFEFFSGLKQEISNIDSMLNNSNIFNKNIVNSSIDKNILSGLNMGYNIDDQGNKQMTSGYADAIEQLSKNYREATAQANALKMAQDGLSESTVKDILAKQNWSKAEMDAAISTKAFKTAQANATASVNANTTATWANVAATKALSVAKKAASVIGGMLVTTAITAGVSLLISGIVKLIDNVHESEKEIKEAAENAKHAIDDIKSSFDELESTTNDIKERYAELAQGVDLLSNKNLSLSTDDYNEFLDLSNKLAELFPTLTKNYDDNGNAILNLSGDVGSIVSSLDDLIDRQRQLANEEILENLPSVYKDYSNQVDDYTEKLEEAKKKQNSYKQLYDNIKDTEYEVSEDKHVVTFKLNDLTHEEQADTLKYLTDNIEDVNHALTQDLDEETTTITLYLDTEFNGFDARLESAQDDIRKYIDKIKEETSSFSTYINTWLENSWEFQQIDDTKIQQALKQVLFNKDWIDVAKSELGDDATWEDISSWMETNYIKAINAIEDEEMKQNFINLFTMDLTPQVKIDLAQKLQEHFDQNEVQVSLGFILDADDPSSTQNLTDRFNRSLADISIYDPKGYYRLIDYTKDFDEVQMETWLRVTQGVIGADNAINKLEEDMVQAGQYDGFFTEENNSLIDDYASKVNELTEYYNKLHTAEGLSNTDKIALNQNYGIVRDSSEGYAHAILQEISMLEHNDIAIQTLKEAIENCTDAQEKMRLEALLEYLQNLSKESIKAAEGFDNLGNSMSNLKTRADLLREVDENMKEFGKIDTSQLNEILELFPELETQVALYSAGLMDSTKLFNMMTEAYQTDANLYAEAMAEKLQYNETFYDNIYDDIPQHIKDLADSYGIDLENYTTLCAAKLDLETQLAEKRVELYSAITKAYNISRDQYASPEEKAQVQEEYRAVQKEFNDIQSIFDSVKQTTFKQFETSWKKYGKDSDDDDGDDEETKTKIDWADQALSVLQEKVDDAQTALENTHGLDAQLEAVDTLKTALGELKDGYQEAYDEYETRYTNGLKKVSNPDEIKRKIESGEEFVLDEYPAEEAEVIQELIDLYGKMAEAEDKMAELQLQIDNNENIEKSKFRQAAYETLLDSIQTKLEDQTLSTEERNDLLEEQLEAQKAINEELAKQAEYEGDEEGAATLRGKNKILEQQTGNDTLQGTIDDNDLYIESVEKQLENDNLTKKQKDDLNWSLEAFKDKNFQYQFQQMRQKLKEGVWDSYIAMLKEDYGEEKMDDDKFIKKHLKEISEYFNFTGMEGLYYDYVNFGKDNEQITYDTDKEYRSYKINDNDNKIKDIQNKIELNGGVGTEQDYKDMIILHQSTATYWQQQKEAAEDMRDHCQEGTKAWNDWNNEVQECENNLNSCEREIKNCEIAILKLPLNDIELKLMTIENQLSEINELIEYNNQYISAASFLLDREVRSHNKAKELIQDQLDALEKVNNIRKSSLALQQSEYNLRRAMEQKSAKVKTNAYYYSNVIYESNYIG